MLREFDPMLWIESYVAISGMKSSWTYKYMLDNKLQNEWAIWFSFVGDASDSTDNYH